jgi:hypothetical protein
VYKTHHKMPKKRIKQQKSAECYTKSCIKMMGFCETTFLMARNRIFGHFLLTAGNSWRITWFTNRLLQQYYGKNLSYFKAFKTLMRDMYRLEKVLVNKTISAVDYLLEFLKISSKKHLLEKKNGQDYSPEVLETALTFKELEIVA